MFAQRKAPFTPRSTAGRHGYRPAPIRARIGLAMRRGMNFGALEDAEATMRAQGLSLAPMSVGDAGLNVGGTSILPTAEAADIESGALKALVVPAGSSDADAVAALEDVIVRASAKGMPVFAFGEGVAATLTALGQDAAPWVDAPAVMVTGVTVQALGDLDAVSTAARRVG